MTKQTNQNTSDADMSPEAIDRRLRNVSQLHKLGMAIRKARAISEQRSATRKCDSEGRD